MRRSARIAIVTATIAIVANTGEARGQDELLAEGRRAYEREEYDLARETLWKYLDATANLSGAARMPQAEALYYIAVMEPDANVANRHYEIIVDEFPAASVADQALYRLALFELATGRPADARGRFERLQREYPFSPAQPELPLLIGRTHLTEGNPTDAVASFEDGFRRVKTQDLPREMPYAHWLANAHMQAGDEQTAIQYYSLLTLDYPSSPQASEARATLASLQGGGEGEEGVPSEGVIGDVAVADAPVGGPPGEVELPPDQVDPEPQVETPADQAPDLPAIAAPIPQDPGQAAPDRPAAEEEVEQQAPVAQPPAEVEPEPEPLARDEPEPEPVAAEPPAAEPAFEPPPSDGQPPAKFAPADASDLVYLQVGAFNSAARAADLSKRLKAEGFASTIQVAVIEGRGFYRVRVGPFRPETDAERMDEDKEKLTTLGYPAEPVKAE
jgi:cell division protein FtsN/TolA-binding protein